MNNETLLFRIKFGLRIKDLRVKNKLDQASLAAVLGKDKQFINRYENEGANPRADIVQAIAIALKLESIDELYDFSNLIQTEIDNQFNRQKSNSHD